MHHILCKIVGLLKAFRKSCCPSGGSQVTHLLVPCFARSSGFRPTVCRVKLAPHCTVAMEGVSGHSFIPAGPRKRMQRGRRLCLVFWFGVLIWWFSEPWKKPWQLVMEKGSPVVFLLTLSPFRFTLSLSQMFTNVLWNGSFTPDCACWLRSPARHVGGSCWTVIKIL